MAKLIVVLALIFLAWYLRNRFINTAKADRKKLITGWLLWLTIALVVAMALTGRLHWIGGLMALSVPFLRQFALWFMQRKLNQIDAGTGSADNSSNAAAMDRSQALKILNLEESASREDIIQAHRKLMQKNHPDQGGSDYLAAMLNAAKEHLLKELDDE